MYGRTEGGVVVGVIVGGLCIRKGMDCGCQCESWGGREFGGV
jgi:hypothetical protein